MKRYNLILKQTIVFLFLITITTQLSAELSQLRIEGKPERSPDEIVGVRDANGRFCAAIQVISDMEGFSYDSYNGVIRVDKKPGMDMVFLQPDERVLQIFQTGYEPMKIILSEIGINLNSKEVWKIRVTGEKKLINIPIVIISEPSGAIVFIDGKEQGTGKQHTVTEGNHQLKIIKDGYQPRIEAIYVDAQNTLFEYTLQKIEDVDLIITSEPFKAVVYIDNVRFGETPISDFYPAGRYPIRIEKEWYVTYEDYIDIQPPQTTEEYKLNPDFGSIEVASSPQSDMDIYINGAAQNVKTPHTFDRLKPGTYKIDARSQYYETNEAEIQLQRGMTEKVDLISEGNFAILTIKTHENATVYLDGKELTKLNDIRLAPSRVTVEAKMPKAEPVSKRLTLKKGDSLYVDLFPDIQTGTIQVVVTPFDANVELKGDGGEYYTSEGKHIFSDIPVGKYELIAKADKHKTYRESFTLNADERLKKNIALIEGSDIPASMILVEGGTFTMGSNDGKDDEKPNHKVTLSEFYIGKYEVTQREWREVMGSNRSKFKGDDLPVEKVSWYEAIEYCNKKSQKEGLTPCYKIDGKNTTCNFNANGYRLPTEAECEYAARGGNKSNNYIYSGSDNAGDVAWYYDNSKGKTHPVGNKMANELGIYDMTGNVWEWCWDWYGSYSSSSVTDPKGSSSGELRILRGGSWYNIDRFSRIANRGSNLPDFTNIIIGFRIIVSSSSVE